MFQSVFFDFYTQAIQLKSHCYKNSEWVGIDLLLAGAVLHFSVETMAGSGYDVGNFVLRRFGAWFRATWVFRRDFSVGSNIY